MDLYQRTFAVFVLFVLFKRSMCSIEVELKSLKLFYASGDLYLFWDGDLQFDEVIDPLLFLTRYSLDDFLPSSVLVLARVGFKKNLVRISSLFSISS